MLTLIAWLLVKYFHIKQEKMLFAVIVFVPMMVILGLRAPDVGTDTFMYNNLFLTYKNGYDGNIFDLNIEYSFVLISIVLGAFTNNSQSVIFFYAFLTISSIVFLFYKRSTNLFISTVIFATMFYFENFNTMRQCLAVPISYIALLYYIGGSKKRGIAINILATLIHHSSCLFFILYILYPLNTKKVSLFISISAIMLVGILNGFGIEQWGNALLDYKYVQYFASNQYGISKEMGLGVLKAFIFIIVIIFSLYTIKKNELPYLEKQEMLYMILLLTLSCIFTFAQYKIMIFYRLIYPCAFSLCLLIPNICKNIKYNKYYFYLPIAFCLLGYLYYTVQHGNDFAYQMCFV